MKITEIDKNFAKRDIPQFKDRDIYSIPHPSFDLYGVYYESNEGRFRRMPKEIADSVSVGVGFLSQNTAGGRLRFKTNSREIVISAEYDSLEVNFDNGSAIGNSAFVLLEECEDGTFWTAAVTRMKLVGTVNTSVATLRGGMRSYVLYFPNYNGVKNLTIALDKGAKIENGNEYKDVKPILYYGSSITQGGCAARADASYQAVISKWNNVDYINLGFSGSACGEDKMIEYLSTLDCSLFVCDYDHNQHDIELFERSHRKLYERFRSTHPDTPILFLSAPDYEYYAPLKVKAPIIKKHYLDAKRAGDDKVYFYHGKNFFGKKDREICTVDRCHPNTLGMYLMAKKIYGVMKKIDKDFI